MHAACGMRCSCIRARGVGRYRLFLRWPIVHGLFYYSMFGWIECDPSAAGLLAWSYPLALRCLDFYSYQWRTWKRPAGKLLVCGGFSCCPLSNAGKRKREQDPRASQGVDTALLAVHFGADAVLFENVVELVDDDGVHGLFTNLIELLTSHGFTLVAVFRDQDCNLGGFSCRSRVFPYFESNSMASILPPLDPSLVPWHCPWRPIYSILDEPHEVAHLVLQGRYEPAVTAPISQVCPSRVGVFWYRGPRSHLIVGSVVLWEGNDWIVTGLVGPQVSLFLDNNFRLEEYDCRSGN
jgi:hypothetical protein